MKSVWILIPAFNEGKVMASVIRDLHAHGYDNILVVDDGSEDNTKQAAHLSGAEVLRHVINRGQGAALQTGFKYLRDVKDADIVITFDADGQHSPKDISQLIRPLQDGHTDIVLGSRFLRRNSIPFFRRLILKAGILFTSLISHIKLTDTHNGLRALNRTALERIDIVHRGMEHASDIIDEIAKNKLRYQEVPVTIRYTDYSIMKGQRTGSFLRMGIKIILNKYFS